jgi:class 3 adenylate cyclase/predicted ATPase
MDLGDWLRSLGLEQYEAAFRKNEINERVLPRLTLEDLKEIGVGPVGHRRILLDAIVALRNEASTKTTSTDALPTIDKSHKDIAERRQVTVMFTDLVGSTALSAGMDPEDLREVISSYQRCVAETVRRFGGFVARYFGDGALVYFGYPEAHEDDAERSVRAALALIAAVAGLKTRSPLKIRVGIATGLVVVGHLIPSGESDIVGETPNLAARLQSLAKPSMVVIAESTRRLLGSLFQLQDLGMRNLKGIPGPVRSWAVLQPSSVVSRFEALRPSSLTALVGREEEFELLRRRWSKATEGKGQVILLSGEAGIGKSRLTAAFVGFVAGEAHIRLRYFCSPQHTDSALYPIISQMERAAGLERKDSLKRKLDKLDLLLKQTFTSAQDAALIAEMLSLPNDGRYPALEQFSAQQRRERLLAALLLQMETLAQSQAVLMVFEDAHWSDPTTLELFDRVVDRVRKLSVLLIIPFRPEFKPGWTGRPHVTALNLNRLAPREVGAMVDHIVGNMQLSASLRHEIIERTDGIPLFVEEMTKAVLEAESEDEARRAAALVPSPALAVPATLHASLMARLDRLGPAKEVAQIGAALGREFSHALLAAVVREPEANVGLALDRLVQSGLLLQQGVAPSATYSFKHVLVRDAAYSTLLREPRRALHGLIAETLERQFAEIAENQPELLARHWTEAGEIEKAAALWGKAGHRSLQRSALAEAAEQLKRALDHIETLPTTRALRREAIKLQVALITPLLHVSGYAAPETRAAVERARLLIEQAKAVGEPPEDPLLLFSVLYGLWVANLVAFNGDVMRDLAVQFLALSNKENVKAPIMVGHRLMGLSLIHTGNVAEGRAHLDRAMGLYDSAEHRLLATRFGQDVGAATLCWRSLALWLLGNPDAAIADTEHALKLAREIGHSATLMYVLNFSTWSHIHSGNYAAANALIDEFVALKDETGSLFWAGWGMMQQGCLLSLTGKASDAVQTITSGLTTMRTTGTTMWMPVWLSCLAKANAEIGRFDTARRCIADATTAIETTKENWYEAEVVRIAGEIALVLPEPDLVTAEVRFERALTVARQQQAKSWELRAAISMARLWSDQGKRREAQDLLAPVYGWFAEGFDTLDLNDAKVLLDALS